MQQHAYRLPSDCCCFTINNRMLLCVQKHWLPHQQLLPTTCFAVAHRLLLLRDYQPHAPARPGTLTSSNHVQQHAYRLPSDCCYFTITNRMLLCVYEHRLPHQQPLPHTCFFDSRQSSIGQATSASTHICLCQPASLNWAKATTSNRKLLWHPAAFNMGDHIQHCPYYCLHYCLATRCQNDCLQCCSATTSHHHVSSRNRCLQCCSATTNHHQCFHCCSATTSPHHCLEPPPLSLMLFNHHEPQLLSPAATNVSNGAQQPQATTILSISAQQPRATTIVSSHHHCFHFCSATTSHHH